MPLLQRNCKVSALPGDRGPKGAQVKGETQRVEGQAGGLEAAARDEEGGVVIREVQMRKVAHAECTPNPTREKWAEGTPQTPCGPPQPLRDAVPSPGVLLEVGQLAEGLLAVRAVVGLHAQVDAQVLGQVRGIGKRFGAVGALVGLGLCV